MSLSNILMRKAIVERFRVTRDEIEQIFVDAAHWNAGHPRDEPIDPDPNGELRKIADAIDKMLANERALKDKHG